MYLDAVEIGGAAVVPEFIGDFESVRVFDRWRDWGPSHISHHGALCCETAIAWLTAFDRSMLNGASTSSGPRWLRQRIEWGPSVYPIHWCEALKKDSIDCGVHAALAYEVFAARDVECFRVQMVQEFDGPAAIQWRAKWAKDLARTDWMHGRFIYHEGCAIGVGDDRIKIWDPSAGWWLDSKSVGGCGSTRAVRIFFEADQTEFKWGGHAISANKWLELDVDRN